MTKSYRQGKDQISKLLKEHSEDELLQKLIPKTTDSLPKVPTGAHILPAFVQKRWDLLPIDPVHKEAVLDPQTFSQMPLYEKNIENFIGTVKVPVGLAGPLRINGLFAQGDYYIPLATTEAALVASYHRGSLLISEAGGCTACLISEGVCRAPGFAFVSIREVGIFVKWCIDNISQFQIAAESTTNHGKLKDVQITVEGNHVYLIFEYTTGDASGQNMVTISTDAALKYILENSPIKPQHYFIEANMSGDKKASTQSFQTVRGKKVTAEVLLTKDLIKKYLHTTPEKMVKLWYMTAMGGVLSGTIGVQGHYANGLAALYLACGQDVACVAESAVGITRFEITPEGHLYISVTLPNLMVGTVGGGTKLPSQQTNLNIMGLSGPGKAKALAEVCASVALAGELSINGAISAQQFTRAHQRLARGK
jgi:hydroxymethylglutaryl-CoA reductase (NADPH)